MRHSPLPVPFVALHPGRVGSRPGDELAGWGVLCGLVPGVKLMAFRSLSRAMLRGFLRDRTALIFTILLPLLFLALFGSLYKNTSTPKLTVLEVGRVRLLSQANIQQGLGKVLTVTRADSLSSALSAVRKGNYDAAVQQQGNTLTVHYSIADQTT